MTHRHSDLCQACPLKKERSSPQHRLHFGAVKAAYENWPDPGYLEACGLAGFQPINAEHLRGWLYLQVGHFVTIERAGKISERMAREMQDVMRAMQKYTRIRAGQNSYFVDHPMSVAYKELPHKEACKVFKEVEELLCLIFRVQNQKMLVEQYEKAA